MALSGGIMYICSFESALALCKWTGLLFCSFIHVVFVCLLLLPLDGLTRLDHVGMLYVHSGQVAFIDFIVASDLVCI